MDANSSGGVMKISAVIAAGCLTLALGAWTSDVAAQQPTQRPSGSSGAVGSGGGVRTDPATQGTTDRAGQTPHPATPSGQPSGSVAVDDRKPKDKTAEPRQGGGVGATDEPTPTDDGDHAGAPQGTSGTQGTTDNQPTDEQGTPSQGSSDQPKDDNAANPNDKAGGDAAANGDTNKTGSGQPVGTSGKTSSTNKKASAKTGSSKKSGSGNEPTHRQ